MTTLATPQTEVQPDQLWRWKSSGLVYRVTGVDGAQVELQSPSSKVSAGPVALWRLLKFAELVKS